MNLLIKVISLLAVLRGACCAPCDGKTSGTDVIDGIEYNCVSAGHEAIGCFANGQSQPIGGEWQGEPLDKKPFEWMCYRVDADTVAFKVIACFMPNGDRMEVGDSVTMDNIGTYSCVDQDGQVTRLFEGPTECVYNGKTYMKDEVFTTATGELKCFINSGGAKIKAQACIDGDVRADVGAIAEVGGKISKCQAQGENKDELVFVPLEVSDCGDKAIGDEWTEGDINKRCVVNGLAAVTEDYSCNAEDTAFTGLKKMDSGKFYQCSLCGTDCDGSQVKEVLDTECEFDGGHELLSTFAVGNTKYRCRLDGDVASENPIACLRGEDEVGKGKTAELTPGSAVRCNLNDKNELVLSDLSAEEYTAWINSGGDKDNGDGVISAGGGEGTGELVESTTATDAPAEASTNVPTEASTDAPIEASTDAPIEASSDAPTESSTDASMTDGPMTNMTGAPASSTQKTVAPQITCKDKYASCAVIFEAGCDPLSFVEGMDRLKQQRAARVKRSYNRGDSSTIDRMGWKQGSGYLGSGRNSVYGGYKPHGGVYGGSAPAPAPRPSGYGVYGGYMNRYKPQPAPAPAPAPAPVYSEWMYNAYQMACPASCGRC